MRADPRSVLSGRPQAHAPHTTASRAVARRRAVGAVGAVALLFALTTTGAWAEPVPQDTGTTASAEPSPSESPSPSPSPEPTDTPSPTPSPTNRPSPSPSPSENTPSAGDPDDGEESDEESEDEESDEDSDGDESEDEIPSDDRVPSEPGDPATDAPPTGAPAGFDPTTGALELQPLIVSDVRFPAADDRVTATFKATPTSGVAPLAVAFEDTTVCPPEWGDTDCDFSRAWDFEGAACGDANASEARFTETFTTPGKCAVTLTVWANFRFVESVGCDEEDPNCSSVTHTVTVLGPNASFTAVPSSGPAPLTVEFTDTSTGDIDSRSWAFNGPACGSASAGPTEQKFTETFTTPGICVVTLTIVFELEPEIELVDRIQAADTDSASKTITVKPPVTPTQKPDDDDDGDSDDSDDTDDSDDDGDPTPGVFLPNQPPLTDQPSPEPTEPSPAPTTPTKPVNPTPPTPPTEPVDPRSAAWVTGPGASGAGIALMILGAVIGAMGGLSVAGRKVALVADRDENTIQRHVAARDAEGWGDRSFTWRFPGHKLLDAASVVIPDRFHRFSPLLGRITEDGSEFRAMFGTLWLATPLAGAALGLASASAAGGRALPPSVWLVAAGAVLATFDAFSGAVAVVLFAGAALLGGLGGVEGGPDTVHSLLVILATGFLWMAIPLIGSAIRPFRRLGDGSVRHRWDVTADGLIAALLCGWVAQKLTQAMDLFAGQKTGLPDHANTIALVVMAAVALRVTMEHFSMSAYPQRLQQVEGEDPPPPFLISTILGAFIRTAVFGFIGYAFIGSCWQLWLGIGLFLVPQLIDHIREAFPNVGLVRRILPRGVVEIFILVVTCTLIARYAMNQTPDEFTGLRLAFLLIAIPPALLGALRAFAEDADESGDSSWARQFLGAVIVAVTAVLAARGWDY